MKTCSICQTDKPIEEYGLLSRSKDGHAGRCKECSRKAVAISKKRHPETVLRSARTEHSKKRMREWFLNNKGRANANHKAYYNRHRETILKRQRESVSAKEWHVKYYEANLEKVRARVSKYQKDNKGAANASTARRRAMKKNATPPWGIPFFIREIYDLASLRSEATGIKHVVDHIVPLAHKKVCGLHVEDNLQVITRVANSVKSNKFEVAV